MEAAGEVLQHALSLLRLSDQHHHVQERPRRASASGRRDLNVVDELVYRQPETVGTRSAPRSPQGMIQGLSREVEEFQVLLPDGTTEVIAETHAEIFYSPIKHVAKRKSSPLSWTRRTDVPN